MTTQPIRNSHDSRSTLTYALKPALKRYAWGSRTFIARLLGIEPTDEPLAEAWFGAHPTSPCEVEVDGEARRLDALLESEAEALLGAAVRRKHGRLPYLVKLLSAAKPLSIQVHPSAQQALEGYAREEAAGIPRDAPNRCYRDASHKPEVIIALEPFAALCGFRRPVEIASALADLPEIASLMPPYEATDGGLADWLPAYWKVPADSMRAAWSAVLTRLRRQQAERPSDESQAAYWALAAHDAIAGDGPPDPGLLFVFLLELVQLAPGQAMFLAAGVPHAYLRGSGVEVMACSDNVLRAGLTPKHVDSAELMRVVRFEAGAPPILEAAFDARGVGRYALPAAELDVERVRVGPAAVDMGARGGPRLLLVTSASSSADAGASGAVSLHVGDETIALRVGDARLVPAGVAYRLSSAGGGEVVVTSVPEDGPAEATSFRGRMPAALAFGTSGLRGLVTDITDLEAYINTRGFLDYLVAIGDAVAGDRVALGGDLRPSTDSPERSILRAVQQAVIDAGFRPLYCGRLPTPALTYFGITQRIPSVMVTGSHIPFDRNGIKFNKSAGEVLKTDEAGILSFVARQRQRQYAREPQTSAFDDDGWFLAGRTQALPEASELARTMYRQRYEAAFGEGALRGLRLAMYQHSAVGRDLIAEMLQGLGAEVIPARRSDSFVAIDTEAIADERLEELAAIHREVVAQSGAVDAIVSTDGDSDRPMVLAVDDAGQLQFIGGDVLGVVVADFLGADAIAVPISSTDLIDRHFEDREVQLVRTKIGSPWVIAAMATLGGERRVGWEANGGFLVGSPIELEAGRLDPLPTRDAVLPIVAALAAAQKAGCSLHDLVRRLPARHALSGLLDEVPVAISQAMMRRFAKDSPAARAELASVFSSELGFGPIASIDRTDGIRMHFESGDIAHVRPSGNAPQLRIYAVADTASRARAIVGHALAEPQGILRKLESLGRQTLFVESIEHNIDVARRLFAEGHPPSVIGTVSGSASAKALWQRHLARAKDAFRAREAISFHEDLPVNQAFGLLLLWHRLRPHLPHATGALIAFVFGEGSRAAPLTEAECGQKPAIASFVGTGEGSERRYLSTVELALRTFAPVEAHLRRSGFDGMVVKWGDEVQIPCVDLAKDNPLFQNADVVRFVSMREMTEDLSANKDWVGVDEAGEVTAFIPRRSLAEMRPLAERGLLQLRGDKLFGGINLGSIALSRVLLDALLEEFESEVLDAHADRKSRPDLDPQLFTALTIAQRENAETRRANAELAARESAAMRSLFEKQPDIVERLHGVLARFRQRHGRAAKFVAMDFGDQYWGDIGQHHQMYAWFMALAGDDANAAITRALAGLSGDRDERGNLVLGDSVLGPEADVRDTVLIDAKIARGTVRESVLVGTHCQELNATRAFDVQSTAASLRLAERSGAYKVVASEPVQAGKGERVTTVFLPDQELIMRVSEDTDLRDRQATYDAPVLGNPMSFRALHDRVTKADPAAIEARRAQRRAAVAKTFTDAS